MSPKSRIRCSGKAGTADDQLEQAAGASSSLHTFILLIGPSSQCQPLSCSTLIQTSSGSQSVTADVRPYSPESMPDASHGHSGSTPHH